MPKHKPTQPAPSHDSADVSKQSAAELQELASLQAEFKLLESSISELQAVLAHAPPEVVKQEADPVASVFKSFESLIPLVGPLLALI